MRRAILIWLAIIAAETVHGILRTLFLAPVVGDLPARQIGVFVGSTLVLLIACLFAPWLGLAARGPLLAVGAFWVALTIGFEVALGRGVLGMSWERILSDYDVSGGGLMLFGLVVLGISPLVAARIRKVAPCIR